MTRISSEKEFNLVKDSFSAVKNINLKDIGFNQISDSNLYIYQQYKYLKSIVFGGVSNTLLFEEIK